MKINGVEITAVNFDADAEELARYVDYVETRVDEDVARIYVTLCADNTVEVNYIAHGAPFERIRRITGYLVGTIDRWNDAKRAEERDRVKHVDKEN